MKKFFSGLFFIASIFTFSQEILEKYPEGQDDYIGGNVQFYKDFHKIVMDKNLQPCENQNEYYNFQVLIAGNAKIKFIKESNLSLLEENKCVYELSREVAKYMTGWKAATVAGKSVDAVASYIIIPSQLFSTFKENYDPKQGFTPAIYGSGINEFRTKVSRNVNLSGFNYDAEFKLVVTFLVNSEGNISDLKLQQSSGLQEFDERVLKGVKLAKNKWTPAKVYGFPISSRMRMPLNFKL